MTPDDIIAGLRMIEHRTATNATSAKQIVMPSRDECQIVHEARLLIERLRAEVSQYEARDYDQQKSEAEHD